MDTINTSNVMDNGYNDSNIVEDDSDFYEEMLDLNNIRKGEGRA